MKLNYFPALRLMVGATLMLLVAAPLSAQKECSERAETSAVMPEYPGGMDALVGYMSDNFQYPEEAKKAKAEGTIIVKFTVEEDGSVANIKTVTEGAQVRSDLALEAIRLVKGMPKWKPALKSGQPVQSEMSLPVVFKLDSKA